MQTKKIVISLLQALTTVLVLSVATSAQAQWLMAARHVEGRIHQLTQDDQNGKPAYQFATVILEVPAKNVYATVVKLASSNNMVTIVSQDDAGLRLKVAEGPKSASLNVVALSDNTSQLLIAASAGSSTADPGTSQVVASILKVCAEMKKTCSSGGQ